MPVFGARSALRKRLRKAVARWRGFQMPPHAVWTMPEHRGAVSNFALQGQADAFAIACERLGVRPVGETKWGYRRKSIGAAVLDQTGKRSWLKVDGLRGGPNEWQWAGEPGAEAFGDLPKPAVLQVARWTEGDTHWRALRSTIAPSPAIQETPWLKPPFPAVTDRWLCELKNVLDRISSLPMTRWRLVAEQISGPIRDRFGDSAPEVVDEWRSAHGDLNWANLTAPQLSVLDWEHWGRAPRGFDAATLLAFSAADADLFRRIETVFADDLNSPSGVVARLYCFAQRLDGIENGRADPREYAPLERAAAAILD